MAAVQAPFIHNEFLVNLVCDQSLSLFRSEFLPTKIRNKYSKINLDLNLIEALMLMLYVLYYEIISIQNYIELLQRLSSKTSDNLICFERMFRLILIHFDHSMQPRRQFHYLRNLLEIIDYESQSDDHKNKKQSNSIESKWNGDNYSSLMLLLYNILTLYWDDPILKPIVCDLIRSYHKKCSNNHTANFDKKLTQFSMKFFSESELDPFSFSSKIIFLYHFCDDISISSLRIDTNSIDLLFAASIKHHSIWSQSLKESVKQNYIENFTQYRRIILGNFSKVLTDQNGLIFCNQNELENLLDFLLIFHSDLNPIQDFDHQKDREKVMLLLCQGFKNIVENLHQFKSDSLILLVKSILSLLRKMLGTYFEHTK